MVAFPLVGGCTVTANGNIFKSECLPVSLHDLQGKLFGVYENPDRILATTHWGGGQDQEGCCEDTGRQERKYWSVYAHYRKESGFQKLIVQNSLHRPVSTGVLIHCGARRPGEDLRMSKTWRAGTASGAFHVGFILTDLSAFCNNIRSARIMSSLFSDCCSLGGVFATHFCLPGRPTFLYQAELFGGRILFCRAAIDFSCIGLTLAEYSASLN